MISVEVLNPEIGKEAIDDKGIVLDIRARLQDGRATNVEIQARNVAPFRPRLLYYWARVFSQQLSTGEGYTSLRPTISVALLSYREPENARFHSVFRLLETSDHTLYSDALELHLVQLPRLAELTEADRLHDAALLRWTRFFSAESAEEIDEAAMNDPSVSKARDILHRLSADPDVRLLAEERERAHITRRIEDSALLDEGREQGREEGRQRELREAIADVCELVGIAMDDDRRAQLEAMNVDALVALKTHVKLHHGWP